jgi:pantoate--beta-alanine ligase
VNVHDLGDRLEGSTRPGHFRGVATIVLKLFEITVPRFAYFGRKDAQQARVIAQVTRDLNLDTKLVVCPIVREPDGLAMSSRNRYLTESDRNVATVLFRALDQARCAIIAGERNTSRLLEEMRGIFAGQPAATAVYLDIVDADSFEPVTRIGKSYLLVAARIGKTRLIDNMLVDAGDSGNTQCWL